MNSNKLTPGQALIRLLLISGTAYAGYHVYKTYFEGKSPEEIKEMVDDAFKKIGAIIGIVHDASHIAQDAFCALQSGYTSLSTNNITSEKIQRVASLLHNVATLLEDKPEAKESIEIIDESIQLIAENNGIKQLA